MKTVSDGKLSYLVSKLLARMAGGEERLDQALRSHLNDTGNPHGVCLAQLQDIAGGSLLDVTYPVGAIYLSTSPVSPASLFGGTWERLEGRFLLGAGGGYDAGQTGGAATHTMTQWEMPKHNHIFFIGPHGSVADHTFDKTHTSLEFDVQNQYSRGFRDASMTDNTGSGGAFSILPPYLAVYMWKRTA